MNYKLTLHYDGTDFHGWQIQTGQRTVQGELTRALSLLAGCAVTVHGSGRTDAGVHAEGQVASVNLPHPFPPERLRAAINANVGKDLRVMQTELAPDDFHARFSARGKTYVYRVALGPVVSPFWARYVHQEARRLDLDAMQQAAQLFVGTHDWTAFSAAQAEVHNRVRTLTEMRLAACEEPRAGTQLLAITVSAEGFLRYMVRSLVGTLLAVGRGEIDTTRIIYALQTQDRNAAGPTAPPHGLTLLRVHYPPDGFNTETQGHGDTEA